MLVPTKDNWLDLLRAADLLGSRRLQTLALGYLRDNFSVLLQVRNESSTSNETTDKLIPQLENNLPLESDLNQLNAEFPGLLQQVLEMRRQVSPLPPSHILNSRMKEHPKEVQSSTKAVRFPIVAALLGIAALVVYQYTSNMIVMGPYIPFFNGACIAAGVGYIIFFA